MTKLLILRLYLFDKNQAYMGNFKKNGCFYILPNYFEGNTFQDQPIILKDDYDGQFFAQCTFGSHSVNI